MDRGDSLKDASTVKVAVRIRPLSDEENRGCETNGLCLRSLGGSSPQVAVGVDTTFTFDYVFGPDSIQSDIYDTCVVPLVEAAFEGFNATILAYGQTGSGKTHTMGSSTDAQLGFEESRGIIPRVIRHLFSSIAEREAAESNVSFKIYVQFLEIYGEDIKDLLDNTRTAKVAIRETADGDVFVSGAKEELVNSPEQMMKALEDGSRFRTTAATRMNQSSSRSHAIFTVILEQSIFAEATVSNLEDEEGRARGPETAEVVAAGTTKAPPEVRKCKFHFVDLAGSERAKRTGAAGQQLKEGIDINRGLLALGNVISALGDENKRGKVLHVPYRDSKLTRILQDSLGGNSKTLMICCASPSALNYNESINALRYANRARNIQNKPVVNRDPSMVLLDEMKALLGQMSQELLAARRQGFAWGTTATQERAGWGVSESVLQVLASRAAAASSGRLSHDGANYDGGSGGISAISSQLVSALGGGSTPKRSLTPPRDGHLMHSQRLRPHSPQPSVSGRRDSSLAAAAAPTGCSADRDRDRERERAAKSAEQLQCKLRESDFEIARLTEQLKIARQQCSTYGDQSLLLQGERDYYRLQWEATASTATPEQRAEADVLRNDPARRSEYSSAVQVYLHEIDALKRQLASERLRMAEAASLGVLAGGHGGIFGSLAGGASGGAADDHHLESDFTSNVARVIAQTRQQLDLETRRLAAGSASPGVDTGDIGQGQGQGEGEGDGEGSGSPGLAAAGGGEHFGSERGVEEEEVAFQARQRRLREEMSELGESIHAKQQLIEQLQRGQHQYAAMKTYYEGKLRTLELEVESKQYERDGLAGELQGVEASAESESAHASAMRREREARLRDELRKKDDELKALRKKRDELGSLAQIQTKYMQQAQKLTAEVEVMKKQRVDLTKALHSEKKRHLELLNAKVREIDGLKRQLQRRSEEVRRASDAKGKAESRTREALRETALARRKALELLTQGQGQGSAAGQHKSQNAGGMVDVAVASKARAARLALSRASFHAAPRALTDEQQRTKHWLDRRVAEVAEREHAAEALRRQCEQQLALLGRKEALELQRRALLSSKTDADSAELPHSEGQGQLQDLQDALENIDGQLEARDAKIAEMRAMLDGMMTATSSGSGSGSGGVESAQERTFDLLKRGAAATLPAAHEVIGVLLDMAVRHDVQVKALRAARSQMEKDSERLETELAAAKARVGTMSREHSADLHHVTREYEERLLGLLSHGAAGPSAGTGGPGGPGAVRSGSGAGEIGAGASGSNVGNAPNTPGSGSRVVSAGAASEGSGSGSGSGGNGFSPTSAARKISSLLPWSWTSPSKQQQQQQPVAGGASPSSVARASTSPSGIFSHTDDAARLQVIVAVETASALRAQLEREHTRSSALQNKVDDLEQLRSQLEQGMRDKDLHLRFLEDECRLFREIADRLKSNASATSGGLSSTAAATAARAGAGTGTGVGAGAGVGAGVGAGAETEIATADAHSGQSGSAATSSSSSSSVSVSSIIRQVRQRAVSSGLSCSLAVGLVEDEADEDEDTASILGQFDSLAEEIGQLGTLAGLGLESHGARGAGGHGLSSGSREQSVVFSRLTNPSLFTGSMKKVFEQDLVMKRRKVKEIKSREQGRVGQFDVSSVAFTAAAGKLTANAGNATTAAASAAALLLPPLPPLPLENVENFAPRGRGHDSGRSSDASEDAASSPRNTYLDEQGVDINANANANANSGQGQMDGAGLFSAGAEHLGDASLPQPSSLSIYDRLSNPSKFTGIHRANSQGSLTGIARKVAVAVAVAVEEKDKGEAVGLGAREVRSSSSKETGLKPRK